MMLLTESLRDALIGAAASLTGTIATIIVGIIGYKAVLRQIKLATKHHDFSIFSADVKSQIVKLRNFNHTFEEILKHIDINLYLDAYEASFDRLDTDKQAAREAIYQAKISFISKSIIKIESRYIDFIDYLKFLNKSDFNFLYKHLLRPLEMNLSIEQKAFLGHKNFAQSLTYNFQDGALESYDKFLKHVSDNPDMDPDFLDITLKQMHQFVTPIALSAGFSDLDEFAKNVRDRKRCLSDDFSLRIAEFAIDDFSNFLPGDAEHLIKLSLIRLNLSGDKLKEINTKCLDASESLLKILGAT